MKRFLFSMAALLAVVGCAQQEDLVSADLGAANAPEFKVGFESSRVYIDETDGGFKLAWTKGDLLSCFLNAGGQAQYEYVGETGEDSGIITAISCPNGEAIDAFYAVYPYNEANSLADGVLSLVLPAEQAYAEGTFGANSNAMVAVNKAKEPYYTFSNVCGYIRLKVYGDAAITSIKFEGLNDEIIAGAATYNTTTNELAIAGEGKTITLNCNEGVTLGTSEAEATEFWVVVPPKSFEKGFTVTLTDSEGNSMEKVLDKPFTVERNAVHTGVIEYKAAPAREVIFDAQFQANGDAIDGGKFGMTIQKMTRDDVSYEWMTTYTNSTYATPVARYFWTPSDQGNENYPMQKTGYYLVDFSENDEFKAALIDGFTVEAVYMEPLVTPNFSVVVGTNAWSIYKGRDSKLAASYNVDITKNPWDNFGTKAIGQIHEVAKFHHAMMVYNAENQTVKLFVDGALTAENAAETFNIGERLTIGARSMLRTDDNYASAIHHWYGDIAMVKMYSNAFTDDEVAAQYAATTMPTAAELAAPQPIYDAKFNADLSLTNQGTLGAEVAATLTIVNATDPENPLANVNVKVESVNGIDVLHFTHEITKHNSWDTYLIEGNTNGQPNGTTYVINNAALLEKLNDGDFTVELIAAVGHSYPEKPAWGRYSPFSTQGMNVCYWGNTMECKTINPGNAKERNVTPPYVPAVGEYHHFVFVPNVLGHTAGQMEVVYSNGKNALANAYPMHQTVDFTIGASHWPSTISRPFNGYIAAIRIYDNHLGPLEVAALYENAKPIIDALNAANAQ